MLGEPRHNRRTYSLAVAITIGLFAVWGMAHGLYGRIAVPFDRYFELSPLQRYLASASFDVTYVIAAIPAVLLLRKLGYKLVIVFGLVAFSAGAFLLYPAIAQHYALYYVAAVIITSTGWCLLEASANPLICKMGSPHTAVPRLNFAQAFYPLGFVAAVHFSRGIAVPRSGTLDAFTVETLAHPYIFVGLVVVFVAFLIENVEFPLAAVAPVPAGAKLRQEFRTLLLRREFQFAMVAMGTTMIGLVAVSSLAATYIAQTWPDAAGQLVPNASMLFWTVVGIGRSSGAAMMLRWDPLRVLAAALAACILMLGLAELFQGFAGVASLFGTALFLSITFPTVFGEAIRNTGELTKSASGLLVVAAGFGTVLGSNFTAWTLRAGYMHLALTATALCYLIALAAALAISRLRNETSVLPQDWTIASA